MNVQCILKLNKSHEEDWWLFEKLTFWRNSMRVIVITNIVNTKTNILFLIVHKFIEKNTEN